jgi:hypothetical protein
MAESDEPRVVVQFYRHVEDAVVDRVISDVKSRFVGTEVVRFSADRKRAVLRLPKESSTSDVVSFLLANESVEWAEPDERHGS